MRRRAHATKFAGEHVCWSRPEERKWKRSAMGDLGGSRVGFAGEIVRVWPSCHSKCVFVRWLSLGWCVAINLVDSTTVAPTRHKYGLISTNFGPQSAKHGRGRLSLAQGLRILPWAQSNVGDVSQFSASVGRFRADSARFRPTWAQIGSNLGEISAECGPSTVRFAPYLTACGTHRPKCGQLGFSIDAVSRASSIVVRGTTCQSGLAMWSLDAMIGRNRPEGGAGDDELFKHCSPPRRLEALEHHSAGSCSSNSVAPASQLRPICGRRMAASTRGPLYHEVQRHRSAFPEAGE